MQVVFTVRAANWLEATLLDLHFSIWKKSRLISQTDSGCLVIFHLLKWNSPRWWLVFTLMPYLLKYKINPPNSCLKPGETWRGSLILLGKFSSTLQVGVFSFCLCFFTPRLIQQTWAALSGRVLNKACGLHSTSEGGIEAVTQKNPKKTHSMEENTRKIPGGMAQRSGVVLDPGAGWASWAAPVAREGVEGRAWGCPELQLHPKGQGPSSSLEIQEEILFLQ